MKKIIATIIFAFVFLGLYAVDYLSLKGGIATPINHEEQKVYKNAPCMELGYSHIFENNIVCGCDAGFFYQKKDPENKLFKNYMIDFTANAGYDFSLNGFDIIPQVVIGHGNYSFGNSEEEMTNIDYFTYGAKIECSYTFSKYFKLIFEPQFVCYDTNVYLKPVKILLGVGAYF